MENLVPSLLTAISEVRWALGAGRSMRDAVQSYLELRDDDFAANLRGLWIRRQQGLSIELPTRFSHRAHAFWELIERGLQGQPTLDALTALEQEVEIAARHELEMHLATLPFKMLLPLLFLQFPAYLILLLGPVLRELSMKMGAT